MFPNALKFGVKMGGEMYSTGLSGTKHFDFSCILIFSLLFVIHRAGASNRTHSEGFQTRPQDDPLTSHHIAVILYVTITIVVVESFIIFLLGAYVIMNKKKFQSPTASPSVPSISSSIMPASSCSTTKSPRKCPRCGCDVMSGETSSSSLSKSVPMMAAMAVWDEAEKVMPWDQGPMFRHGFSHPLDDGIYQFKYAHRHRRRKMHRHNRHRPRSFSRSERIRLQVAATTNDHSPPLNNLNIDLLISKPNHHKGHTIPEFEPETTLAPSIECADEYLSVAQSGFVSVPKENDEETVHKFNCDQILWS